MLFIGIITTFTLYSQVPETFIYQAESRDANGHIIKNTTLDVKAIILKGDPALNDDVWESIHTVTTDKYGLFTIEIGVGVDEYGRLITAIDWADGVYSLNIQVFYKGQWTSMGTTKFLSVPYALMAKSAESALSADYEDIVGAPTDLGEFTNFHGYITNSQETDPVFTAWDKSEGIVITESQVSDLVHFTPADEEDPLFNAWDKSTGIVISEDQVSDLVHFTPADEEDPLFTSWDKSTDIVITESQVSDLVHFTTADEEDPLFTAWDKSEGIVITESQVSDLVHFTPADETDPIFGASPANTITGDDITDWNNAFGWGDHAVAGYLSSLEWSNLTGIPAGFADDIDNVDDADPDPLNELQTLAIAGNIITLSDEGGSVELPETVAWPSGDINDLVTYDGSNWVAKHAVIGNTGNQQIDIVQPWLGIYHAIALTGVFPSRNSAEPFIGEIMMVGFSFPPRGWALCDGQILAISQHTALFSLLGTTFGGDGRSTFGLPDLRGRVAIHPGTGPGLTTRNWGQKLGREASPMPIHTHTITYQE